MIAALSGCSIAGDWKLTKVTPEGKEFPISTVNFAEDGTYSATSNYGGKPMNSSGTYKWTGTSLTINPEGKPSRTYSGHMGMDSKLVLTHDDEKGKMTGTLEKQAGKK
jgi:hypothetical protein